MTAEPPHRFALNVPAEAAYLSTVRLFVAAVARAVGAGEELVEDLRLASSELVTAIVAGEARESVEVRATLDGRVLELVVGPLLPGDLIDGAIDPVDIVLALFPETTRDLEQSIVHLPVDLDAP